MNTITTQLAQAHINELRRQACHYKLTHGLRMRTTIRTRLAIWSH
jgi:hypothetical protein